MGPVSERGAWERPHPAERFARAHPPLSGEGFTSAIDYHPRTNQAPAAAGDGLAMLPRLFSTAVKVAVASLIVGTILDHFGITADVLLREVGLTPERVAELAKRGLAWAVPNLLLGALIIVPIWFVVYLFRPPGQHSD